MDKVSIELIINKVLERYSTGREGGTMDVSYEGLSKTFTIGEDTNEDVIDFLMDWWNFDKESLKHDFVDSFLTPDEDHKRVEVITETISVKDFLDQWGTNKDDDNDD